MSGVVDAFGADDAGPMSRTATRIAHLLLPAAVVLISIPVARIVTGGLVPSWLSTSAWWVLNGVCLVAGFHQALARICVRCMSEVPADASAQAERKRWLLKVEHVTIGWRFLLAWGVCVVGVGVVQVLLFADYASGQGEWVWLPVYAVILTVIYASWIHHRISPWCPYCKPWDEGGEREPSPTPDPSGVKSA